ncbi:tyrosine-protein phosphatase [Vogesella sp. DC21W]|uniref:Tyrosine-protein phosphatase n=1 Tax=Vogesella aquatica TaxID=2984206 RepID=A0ABT5IWQ8_9NEIS|nr:tyrosine-protein phosphatase [Vogesella aquatica]MDC7716999.1 tyrosine-protein phosphatase [Vogesella aquatica]
MSHPFDTLAIPAVDGRLLLTPCPGTQAASPSLARYTLQQAGASGVISLMPATELQQNGADGMGAACGQLGLAWFYLPLADECAPRADFASARQAVAPDLLARLRAGQCLAMHCKGGSGRTGLFAARILMALGVPRSTAIAQVQALRPKAMQHPVHQAWIGQYDAV